MEQPDRGHLAAFGFDQPDTLLSLGRNNVTDVSALAGLTNLTVLILKSNQISDLSPLVANKGLGAGGTVDVTDNPLNPASHSTHVPASRHEESEFLLSPPRQSPSPTPTCGRQLQRLWARPPARRSHRLDMATLTRLSASSAGIRNLIGLESAANLTRLFLSSNSITDISPLAGLTNVSALDLMGQPARGYIGTIGPDQADMAGAWS